MTDPIEGLLDEVRLLFHCAVQTGERLHAGESVTLGMRGVLEFLQRNGPAPVPEIARRRLVTRQHIQTLVNALLKRKLVALEANPAHRRSPFVSLTADGTRAIDRMRRREARLYARMDLGIRREEIERAAGTLARVRAALGGAE